MMMMIVVVLDSAARVASSALPRVRTSPRGWTTRWITAMTMTHSPWLHCGEDHSDCRSMVRTGPGRCTQGVYYDAAAYHDNDDDDKRVIDDGSWSVRMSSNEYRDVCLSISTLELR